MQRRLILEALSTYYQPSFILVAANIDLKLNLPVMTLMDLLTSALRIQSKQNMLSQSPNLYQRVISIGAVKNVRPGE